MQDEVLLLRPLDLICAIVIVCEVFLLFVAFRSVAHSLKVTGPRTLSELIEIVVITHALKIIPSALATDVTLIHIQLT